MRTPEQKLATKLRKKAVRDAHRAKVWKKHPTLVRYAKAKFKKGSKRQKRSTKKIQLGVQ
jgi:hypothetical protein